VPDYAIQFQPIPVSALPDLFDVPDGILWGKVKKLLE
jgi:hypothetical protein